MLLGMSPANNAFMARKDIPPEAFARLQRGGANGSSLAPGHSVKR